MTTALACRRPATARRMHAAAFQCPVCGGVSALATSPCGCGVPPDPAAVPARLADSLVVIRRLGSGTTGSVYLAHDTVLDRDVAVKAARHPGSSSATALSREARAMASLNHPALATIYGLHVWRHAPLLIVEYFPDGTLARRLERGTLAIDAVAMLGASLAGGLAYMHEKGRVHRDLKPSNIGLTECHTPKLLDFGLAGRPISWGLERTGVPDGRVAGTSAYLPPEAYNGASADPAFDLWALSAVLLEALTGSPDPRLLDAHPVPSAPLPPALHAFFARALDSRPSWRHANTREWIEAFEAAVRT